MCAGALGRTPARGGIATQRTGPWPPPRPRLPRPAGQVETGIRSLRVVRAARPLDYGQQRGGLVPGPGRVPGLPGRAGQVVPGSQGARVLRAENPLADGNSAATWSRAPAGSPAVPVQKARSFRAVRVPESSGPRTRTRASTTFR